MTLTPLQVIHGASLRDAVAAAADPASGLADGARRERAHSSCPAAPAEPAFSVSRLLLKIYTPVCGAHHHRETAKSAIEVSGNLDPRREQQAGTACHCLCPALAGSRALLCLGWLETRNFLLPVCLHRHIGCRFGLSCALPGALTIALAVALAHPGSFRSAVRANALVAGDNCSRALAVGALLAAALDIDFSDAAMGKWKGGPAAAEVEKLAGAVLPARTAASR